MGCYIHPCIFGEGQAECIWLFVCFGCDKKYAGDDTQGYRYWHLSFFFHITPCSIILTFFVRGGGLYAAFREKNNKVGALQHFVFFCDSRHGRFSFYPFFIERGMGSACCSRDEEKNSGHGRQGTRFEHIFFSDHFCVMGLYIIGDTILIMAHLMPELMNG